METFKQKYTERDRQGDKIIKIQTEKYTERDKQRESEKEKDRKRWTTRAL